MTTGVGDSNIEEELSSIEQWSEKAPPITKIEYEQRINRACEKTARENADALIVCAGASLRYFTGIDWEASERFVALVLPVDGAPTLICPRFELGSLEATLVVSDINVSCWEEDENPFTLTYDTLRSFRSKVVAIDPDMAFSMAARLNAAGFEKLSDGAAIIEHCRSKKSKAEIALMQQAKNMTLEVQRHAARILKAGISTATVRRFINEAHQRIGASGSSFCMVLFDNATSFPHGAPHEQILENNDPVLIDTGCTVEGYNSDITRSYVFGEPSAAYRKIWRLQRDAQAAAFQAAKLGASCEQVDIAAREIITDAGLGPGYALPGLPHRTGHGIGLSIHEAPYLVRGDTTPIDVGMCFSNEPTIVFPGEFGVRLEDHFYMSENGPVWFTKPPTSISSPFDT